MALDVAEEGNAGGVNRLGCQLAGRHIEIPTHDDVREELVLGGRFCACADRGTGCFSRCVADNVEVGVLRLSPCGLPVQVNAK
jgi:hypothetical protein